MKNIFRISILMLSILGVILTSCDTATTLVATDPTIKGFDVYSAKAGEYVTVFGEGFGAATDKGYLNFAGAKLASSNIVDWTDTKVKIKVPSTFTKDTLVSIQIVNDTKQTAIWDFFVGDLTPKNFEATSKDSSSVLLIWDKSPLDKVTGNTNVFDHYHLVITDDKGTALPTLKLPAGTTSYTAKSLTPGTIYNFELRGGFKNDTMSTASRIKWSPAFRFTNTTNGVAIKLYESASKNGSGLDLYNATGGSSDVQNIANSNLWNLGINTKSGKLVFGSASDLGYTYTKAPQDAQMATVYFSVNSLDAATDSQAMDAAAYGLKAQSYDISELETISPSTGYVFIVRTMELGQTTYNYAKVFVKRTGGKILQGTGTDRYIEVEVSYQKKAGVAYAKKH